MRHDLESIPEIKLAGGKNRLPLQIGEEAYHEEPSTRMTEE